MWLGRHARTSLAPYLAPFWAVTATVLLGCQNIQLAGNPVPVGAYTCQNPTIYWQYDDCHIDDRTRYASVVNANMVSSQALNTGIANCNIGVHTDDLDNYASDNYIGNIVNTVNYDINYRHHINNVNDAYNDRRYCIKICAKNNTCANNHSKNNANTDMHYDHNDCVNNGACTKNTHHCPQITPLTHNIDDTKLNDCPVLPKQHPATKTKSLKPSLKNFWQFLLEDWF